MGAVRISQIWQVTLAITLWSSALCNHMEPLLFDKEFKQVEQTRRSAGDTERDCSDPNNIYLPPTAVDTSQRLKDLRDEMTLKNYDAYIVPSGDAHLSEYISTRDKRREWISGFSGSAGIAVVTKTEAAMWTDGRYFIQAERQMDCNWQLMKTGEPDVLSLEDWISEKLNTNETIGSNPFLSSIATWQNYESYFEGKSLSIEASEPDLIDVVWVDRPGNIGDGIIIHPLEYAGQDWQVKVEQTRVKMAENEVDILLVTLLDEIAWLFNLRGNDIPFTPVFMSYAIIHQTDYVKLYVNPGQVDYKVSEHLNPPGCTSTKSCVESLPYEDAPSDLKTLAIDANKVWMPKSSTTFGMYKEVDSLKQYEEGSPLAEPKAIKNAVQVEEIKQAHIYDALSLCEYLHWLDNNVPKGTVDEISGSDKLEEFRLSNEECVGLSFSPISASGPNGAVLHYSATEETKRKLTTDEMYLLDSGGHYMGGTTDITRTVHFGQPTPYQIETFTRVLMGLIDVEMALFPNTRDGTHLDILVRKHLYDVGLDFKHGSGHGVGQYLNVHEFPPAFGRSHLFQPGMFCTIEPGFYEDNSFGIRIENFLLAKEAKTKYKFSTTVFTEFESITLVPIQQKLINATIMSDVQLAYLNDYHRKVYDVIGEEARRRNKMEVFDWIKESTTPIYKDSASTGMMSLTLFIICTIVSMST